MAAGTTDLLLAERAALCETFETVGPNAPTLCEGWLAVDLAAHLVVRERRPTGMPGIVLGGPFAQRTEALMAEEIARGFDALIATLAAGPPVAFRVGPAAAPNLVENWIHHEDLRRAQGSVPRPPDAAVDEVLWTSVGLSGRIGVRRLRGVGLVVEDPAGRTRVLRRAEPRVTVRGTAGEIVLFLSGRKEAADVELDGPAEARALVLAARFGL